MNMISNGIRRISFVRIMEGREKGVNGKEKEKEMEILFAVEIVTVVVAVVVAVVVTVVVSNGGRVEIFVVIHCDMWLDSAAPSTGIDFIFFVVSDKYTLQKKTNKGIKKQKKLSHPI